MTLLMLDPEAVLTFILVSEYKSFTKAAQALNSTQSAVSMRLRRLEEQLGTLLIERSTRSLKLSSAGQTFLKPAQEFMAAHDRAKAVFADYRPQLRIGITHHLLGLDISPVLAAVAHENSDLIVNLTVNGSEELLALYERCELDAIILLKHPAVRRHGETIGLARFGWFGKAQVDHKKHGAIPLVIHPQGCSMREMAVTALQESGIAWREAFIATSANNLRSAIVAGFGVGVLSVDTTENGLCDIGRELALPILPSREIMLFSQVSSHLAQRGLDRIRKAIGGLNQHQAA